MIKPVAWMHKDLKDGWLSCTNQHPETEIDDWLPLYTYPADLTDEYCKAYWGKDNCFVDVFLPNSETEVIRFWNDQLNESYESKTLTDDVVNELWAESQEDGIAMQQGFTTQQHYFAYLILRKASE